MILSRERLTALLIDAYRDGARKGAAVITESGLELVLADENVKPYALTIANRESDAQRYKGVNRDAS